MLPTKLAESKTPASPSAAATLSRVSISPPVGCRARGVVCVHQQVSEACGLLAPVQPATTSIKSNLRL